MDFMVSKTTDLLAWIEYETFFSVYGYTHLSGSYATDRVAFRE